jgi:glyoxalase family protein
MNNKIKGIHHITAIASDPQRNLGFYSGVLGLRLVKKTVNFDAPDTYHLYYGDETGQPGTILTFFPWGKNGWYGRAGTGQVTVISLAIAETAMEYWIERLQEHDLSIQGPFQRFEEEVIAFRDPDGIQLELVASKHHRLNSWENQVIPVEYSIQGLHSVTLSLRDCELTNHLLIESLDFQLVGHMGKRRRYRVGDGSIGSLIDLLCLPDAEGGRIGVGAVHHIAWRVANNAIQNQKRDILTQLGYQVSPVMDRNYFHSIYFKDPGNVLFEIATDSPGFLVDESKEFLGSQLKLPVWYEARRNQIEAALPKL